MVELAAPSFKVSTCQQTANNLPIDIGETLMWIAKALLGLTCPVASMGVLNAQAGPVQSPPQHDSRIFGILPNYRTIPDTLEHVEPLSSGEKWKLATMESF